MTLKTTALKGMILLGWDSEPQPSSAHRGRRPLRIEQTDAGL